MNGDLRPRGGPAKTTTPQTSTPPRLAPRNTDATGFTLGVPQGHPKEAVIIRPAASEARQASLVPVQGIRPSDQSATSWTRNFATESQSRDLTVEDILCMWRDDMEAHGLESPALNVLADRTMTSQISHLNLDDQRTDRPMAVPSRGNAKEPQPLAIGSWNRSPESNIGGLDQARRAKNLKVFDPRVSQAKVWLTNFLSIRSLNQLTDRQKVTFFHECLDDDP